jgi:hypothetical protein
VGCGGTPKQGAWHTCLDRGLLLCNFGARMVSTVFFFFFIKRRPVNRESASFCCYSASCVQWLPCCDRTQHFNCGNVLEKAGAMLQLLILLSLYDLFWVFIITLDKRVAVPFPLFHLGHVHSWNDSIKEDIEASKGLIDWRMKEFPGVTRQVNVSICNSQPHNSWSVSSILSKLRPSFSTTFTLI